MRIAVVEPVARGGMIHYAFQLARGLTAAGAEVTLVTGRHFELESLAADFTIAKPLRLWDPKSAKPVLPLARPLRRATRGVIHYANWLRWIAFVKRLRPDFVLLGDIRFPADALMLAFARRCGLRLVDICHNIEPFKLYGSGSGSFQDGRWRHFFYGLAYRQFARVYVHFESNRQRFLDRFALPEERVGVIPHGNESLFGELHHPVPSVADLRQRLGLDSTEKVILLFGSLSHYKGADLLIEAYARIHDRAPLSRLILAGPILPDANPQNLRALARRFGCLDRLLIIPGYIDSAHVASWMKLADMAVFPYRAIFQSGALVVAQTFGLPTVVTSVGAMIEATDGGRCALVIPPEDPDALANAMLQLLEDPELAARLGRDARVLATGRYDWNRIGAILLADLEYLHPLGQAGAAPLGKQGAAR